MPRHCFLKRFLLSHHNELARVGQAAIDAADPFANFANYNRGLERPRGIGYGARTFPGRELSMYPRALTYAATAPSANHRIEEAAAAARTPNLRRDRPEVEHMPITTSEYLYCCP
jgi:hypothetical protein